jgi:hypothetical protein
MRAKYDKAATSLNIDILVNEFVNSITYDGRPVHFLGKSILKGTLKDGFEEVLTGILSDNKGMEAFCMPLPDPTGDLIKLMETIIKTTKEDGTNGK